MLRVNL